MTEHRLSRMSAALLSAFYLAGMVSMAQAQTAAGEHARTVTDEQPRGRPWRMDEGIDQIAPDVLMRDAEIRALRKQLQHVSPEVEKAVPLASVLRLNNAREIFQHLDTLYPVSSISRGSRGASELAAAPMNLDAIRIEDGTGNTVSFADWQRNTVTDGLLVLHRGQVVFEKYYAGMSSTRRHALWSVTKSMTGLIAADLIEAGTIDPTAPVSHYLPELRDSAWGDATVQQTLDMTTGVDYTEGALEPESGVLHYMVAAGLIPTTPLYPGPRNVIDFLKTRKKAGEHGKAFKYKTPDTEVIGLLLTKVTGKDIATLVSERLWAPMGAETDAFILKDRQGTQLAGAGVNSTLRDLARLGELVRLEGRFNGKQILQPGTVAGIRKGGDRAAFAAGGHARRGYSYHNFWWVSHDASGSFEAKGLNGQHIHVNPANELVIVKLSSNILPDTISTHVPDRNAFAAIAQAVRGR